MTKAFTNDSPRGFKSLHVGAQDTQNHDGTYGMQVVDASLADPKTKNNNFYSIEVDMTSGAWIDNIKFRPRKVTMNMLRLRNATTGAFNTSTSVLDLSNGTGSAVAGDVFAFTFLNNGPKNDNLTGLLLWAKRSASAATSTLRAAFFDITALASRGQLVSPPQGINTPALVLDKENYYTAAIAHLQIPFDDISALANGGPLYININYNSKEIRSSLVDGHTYAVVLYLVRGGVETGTVTLYGSEDATVADTIGFYQGANGWSGVLAVDATLKVPFHKVFANCFGVVNQIHIYSEAPNNLSGTVIESCLVKKIGDGFTIDLLNEDKQNIEREVIGRLNLANERRHSVMFEGKVVIPRHYNVDFLLLCGYTGKIYIEFNYWIDPSGDV